MNKRAILYIVAGVIGGAIVMSYDIITGKPVNDFTGPVSTPLLVICAIFIIVGFILLIRKPTKKKSLSA